MKLAIECFQEKYFHIFRKRSYILLSGVHISQQMFYIFSKNQYLLLQSIGSSASIFSFGNSTAKKSDSIKTFQ